MRSRPRDLQVRSVCEEDGRVWPRRPVLRLTCCREYVRECLGVVKVQADDLFDPGAGVCRHSRVRRARLKQRFMYVHEEEITYSNLLSTQATTSCGPICETQHLSVCRAFFLFAFCVGYLAVALDCWAWGREALARVASSPVYPKQSAVPAERFGHLHLALFIHDYNADPYIMVQRLTWVPS